MIKKFSVLYVGQIELENIGLEGTPSEARRYPNDAPGRGVWTARDVAQLWMSSLSRAVDGEHHFHARATRCFRTSSSSALARDPTRRLKFGCAFNVLPMWLRPPRRGLRDGRHRHRRARHHGGRPRLPLREVESFGPGDRPGRQRELFEEQVEVLLKCFNEDAFSTRGKHYTIPPEVEYRGYTLRDVTCVPRPSHLPVEIWMPIASGKTIDFMARHDLKAMVTLNGEKILDDVVRAYQAACAKVGRVKQLGEDMIWGAGIYLADSAEEAIRRVEPSHDERYKWFAPFGFVRYADEQGRTWGTPGAPARTPSLRDGVAQKAWFCGSPGHVIDGIRSIADKYPGLEDFMIHWAEGLPPKEFKEASLVRA